MVDCTTKFFRCQEFFQKTFSVSKKCRVTPPFLGTQRRFFALTSAKKECGTPRAPAFFTPMKTPKSKDALKKIPNKRERSEVFFKNLLIFGKIRDNIVRKMYSE